MDVMKLKSTIGTFLYVFDYDTVFFIFINEFIFEFFSEIYESELIRRCCVVLALLSVYDDTVAERQKFYKLTYIFLFFAVLTFQYTLKLFIMEIYKFQLLGLWLSAVSV